MFYTGSTFLCGSGCYSAYRKWLHFKFSRGRGGGSSFQVILTQSTSYSKVVFPLLRKLLWYMWCRLNMLEEMQKKLLKKNFHGIQKLKISGALFI